MIPKINRFRGFLCQQELDGAIASSPENFHYITGFAGHQHTVSRSPGFTFAVFCANKSIPGHIATMDFEFPTFKNKTDEFVIKKYDTWVGVKQWEEIADGAVIQAPEKMETSMDVLVQTVKELNLANKRVGVELGYLPVGYYRTLQEKLPEVEFVDISDMFILARSVKTPEEIQMFRNLCKVADDGFTEVSKIAAVGATEKDLVDVFQRTVIASGLCMPSAWSMFATGPNGARLCIPEGRVIAIGDVVKFDGGVNAAFDFYTTDTSRSWIMDGAHPELYKLKDRLYEAQQKMIAIAKPGLPICELFDTGFNYVKEKYSAYRRGHLGHNISMGPQTCEPPLIASAESRPLEAGMILAMEVPCYILGVGGFNIEDMVLITETGAEVLTSKTPHYLK